MRVAVLGARGPVGAAVVESLQSDPHKRVSAVIAMARTLPRDAADVEWKAVDLAATTLASHLRGVDALVNAARARSTFPARSAPDDAGLARRVLDIAVTAGVRHVVQLGSFLAYSPPPDPWSLVDERWPTDGLSQSPAAMAAVALERTLDDFAGKHEIVRLVRIRAGVPLGPRVRRAVLVRAGPFACLLRLFERAPVVPGVPASGVPAVHHDDLADAVRVAVTHPALGAYNVALDEPLRPADVASALNARPIGVPAAAVRRGAALADRVLDRMPGNTVGSASAWLEALAHAPRLDTSRARDGLEWAPRHSLAEALRSTLVTL